MNILYVCHRFPYPPKRGGKIRPFNMIKHFGERGHSVTVCSLARSPEEAAEAKGITPYCSEFHVAQVKDWVQGVRMVARLPTMVPSSMGYFYSRALAATIDAVLASKKIDLIFVHCSSVAQYVRHVQGIPKILDFGDMDSQKWLEYAQVKSFPLSLGYWLEGKKLEREERALTESFDLCTATTKMEWQTLKDYGVTVDTDWFPNGVDSAFFHPTDAPYDPDTISFVGRMDYYPNQQCMFDFCEHTLPLIRARNPKIRLLIIGADPSEKVLNLGTIPGVTVTGTVPDVRPLVRSSAVMVAPLSIARGTQNKILEAMAMGVPVVTSGIAAGGVDAVPEEHLLVGNSPEQVASAVLRLTESASERSRLAKSGRERVLSNHSWASSMLRLDDIVQRCVATTTVRGRTLKFAMEGNSK